MNKLDLDERAMANAPLTKATVRAIYEGNVGNLGQIGFMVLCESHERLRMELEGAMILLEKKE